jgi:zinc transport system permease protein
MKMDFINDILQYNYLSNALIACILSGVTCGIIGTYIVARRMVFLCGGITHASFGGLGIALYLNANPILGATIFAILSALGIEWSNSRSKIRPDSAIGMVWGIGMAIGALFMTLRPGYTSGDMASFLFGNILTVTNSDIIALIALAIVLIIGTLLWHRPIMFAAFDSDFAKASGVPVALIHYLMAVVTAITIVLSIRTMGIVLLISLLTMPVVTANTISKDYKRIIPISVLVATFAGLIGLVFSYHTDAPSGPAIIFLLTLSFLTIKLLSLLVKRIKRSKTKIE